MKFTRWILFVAALLIVIPPIESYGQTRQIKREVTGDIKGEPFNIGELGALILNMYDTLRVFAAAPSNMRLKAYQSIDIQEGDIVIMVNGKRAKVIEDLTAAYNATETGKNYELGVKRDGKMMLVSFAKADEKDLPKQKMMMMTSTDDGSGEKEMVMSGGKMEIPEGITDVEPLMGLGLLVGMKDGKPVVAGLLAKDDKAFADIKPGDEIIWCEGKKVASVADVSAAFDGVKDGAKFTFVVHRGEKEVSVSKTKEAAQGSWKVEKH